MQVDTLSHSTTIVDSSTTYLLTSAMRWCHFANDDCQLLLNFTPQSELTHVQPVAEYVAIYWDNNDGFKPTTQ